MKFKKNTVLLLSLVLGSTMFVTTAFAEVNSKNGYVQFKDSLKLTSDSCRSKLDNYTTNFTYSIKDNDLLLVSESSISKYDIKNTAREGKRVNNNLDQNSNKLLKAEYSSYEDNKINISTDNNGDKYYVTEFASSRNLQLFPEYCKTENTKDIEKVIDAVIGNLQDSLVVNQNSDGSKLLSASLKESQIPAIVNALVTYEAKNSFRDASMYFRDSNTSAIKNDMYLKSVDANIKINKSGLIDSILGTLQLSGKDAKGIAHTYTYDILFKLTDVNSTTVKKPDLTGKNIEKSTQSNSNTYIKDAKTLQKYLGKYSTDIFIEKDNNFIKIGSRNLNITEINDKSVIGEYSETYLKGYENFDKKSASFKFTASFTNNGYEARFSSPGSTDKGTLYIEQSQPYIGFFYDGQKLNSGNFIKIIQ